ncbi:MAG: cyclophilin-like fold protein [Nitrosopumilus sp.]|nr:cyclophilin-like fold protein [Nitrosopumilus sp.]
MYELSTSSVSKKQLILEIRGNTKISCDLKRHLSPRTVGTIMRSLPLEGNAHFLGKSILYFETNVDSGTERARSEFKKGDVAFLSSSRSICFFMNDVVSGKAMTPIGKLGDNIDMLKDVKSGDVLCIYEETA